MKFLYASYNSDNFKSKYLLLNLKQFNLEFGQSLSQQIKIAFNY